MRSFSVKSEFFAPTPGIFTINERLRFHKRPALYFSFCSFFSASMCCPAYAGTLNFDLSKFKGSYPTNYSDNTPINRQRIREYPITFLGKDEYRKIRSTPFEIHSSYVVEGGIHVTEPGVIKRRDAETGNFQQDSSGSEIRFSYQIPVDPYQKMRKQNAVMEGVYQALSLVDAGQTIYCVQQINCHEANPILGRKPSIGAILAFKALTGTAHYLGFKKLNKRDPKTARTFERVSIAVQGSVVGINFATIF